MSDNEQIYHHIYKNKDGIDDILNKCTTLLEPLRMEDFEKKFKEFQELANPKSKLDLVDTDHTLSVEEINDIFDELRTLPACCKKPKPPVSIHGSRSNLNKTVMAPPTPRKKPDIDWEKMQKTVRETQSMIMECKSLNQTAVKPNFGNQRRKFIKKFEESLANIQNMKKWLELNFKDAKNKENDEVFVELQKVNEHMDEVAKIISDFNFVQENSDLPMGEVKDRDVQTPYEEQIRELCEVVASINNDQQ